MEENHPALRKCPVSSESFSKKRKVLISLDLTDKTKSADTVRWAIHHLLRAGDTVVLLHVQSIKPRNLDRHFYDLASQLARPLIDAKVPYDIIIIKGYRKERVCSEINNQGCEVAILGSLGTIGDYCLENGVCPFVVVRSSIKKRNGHVAHKKYPVKQEKHCHSVRRWFPTPEAAYVVRPITYFVVIPLLLMSTHLVMFFNGSGMYSPNGLSSRTSD